MGSTMEKMRPFKKRKIDSESNFNSIKYQQVPAQQVIAELRKQLRV